MVEWVKTRLEILEKLVSGPQVKLRLEENNLFPEIDDLQLPGSG